MNFHSKIKLTGKLVIKKFDSRDELIDEVNINNLIVTVGKVHVAERIISDTETKMSHMALGSGLDNPALADTDLGNELDRAALSAATRTGANITYTATFPAGVATGSITEAGIFNDGTAGTMLCRTTFPVITKSASETVAISWTVTVG